MENADDHRAEPAQGILDMGKSRLAHQFGEASQVVRETGDKLGGGCDSPAGKITARMAEALQKAGDYLDSAEPKRLIRDAKDTARRQPEVFLGTAFITGLILGRLLRSQSPKMTGPNTPPGPPGMDAHMGDLAGTPGLPGERPYGMSPDSPYAPESQEL